MDPFFGPMLSQGLEHRETRKTAYTFPRDALEKVSERQESTNDRDHSRAGDEVEVAFDDSFDRRAIPTHQQSHQEEARATGDDRQDHEPEKAVAREPRRDGDELVGDRCQALQE